MGTVQSQEEPEVVVEEEEEENDVEKESILAAGERKCDRPVEIPATVQDENDENRSSTVEELRMEIRALQARVDALTLECQSAQTENKKREKERWNHAQFHSLARQVRKLEQQQQQSQQDNKIDQIVKQRVQEALEDQLFLHMDRFYKMMMIRETEVPSSKNESEGTSGTTLLPIQAQSLQHFNGGSVGQHVNKETETTPATIAMTSSNQTLFAAPDNDDFLQKQRMDQFWEETRRLEEHLSMQFATHERQFVTNASMDQLVSTFDEQLAEILDVVQDHVEEHQNVHVDLRNHIQYNKQQQLRMQTQLHAMQETWKQKLDAFRQYLEEHQPESLPLWQDVLKEEGGGDEQSLEDESNITDHRASIDQPNVEIMTEWKEQMNEWSRSIRDQIEELQAVRDAYDQMHADMQRQTESMRMEFRQYLETVQGQARVAQTMHNELVRMGETSRLEMDENRSKIETLDAVLQELARRTQMQTNALKANKDSLRSAYTDRDRAVEMAEATREMVLELRNELDDTKAQLTVTMSKQAEMLRTKERRAKRNILDRLGKHKSRIRELLSEDDCASIMVSDTGIEVGEFRDAISPSHFGSASNESFYFSRDAETTTTLSYE
jgi:hypothetical protein